MLTASRPVMPWMIKFVFSSMKMDMLVVAFEPSFDKLRMNG